MGDDLSMEAFEKFMAEPYDLEVMTAGDYLVATGEAWAEAADAAGENEHSSRPNYTVWINALTWFWGRDVPLFVVLESIRMAWETDRPRPGLTNWEYFMWITVRQIDNGEALNG